MDDTTEAPKEWKLQFLELFHDSDARVLTGEPIAAARLGDLDVGVYCGSIQELTELEEDLGYPGAEVLGADKIQDLPVAAWYAFGGSRGKLDGKLAKESMRLLPSCFRGTFQEAVTCFFSAGVLLSQKRLTSRTVRPKTKTDGYSSGESG